MVTYSNNIFHILVCNIYDNNSCSIILTENKKLPQMATCDWVFYIMCFLSQHKLLDVMYTMVKCTALQLIRLINSCPLYYIYIYILRLYVIPNNYSISIPHCATVPCYATMNINEVCHSLHVIFP